MPAMPAISFWRITIWCGTQVTCATALVSVPQSNTNVTGGQATASPFGASPFAGV